MSEAPKTPTSLFTKEHVAVFQRINESVPKELLDKLVYTAFANPTMREVVDRGLLDPDLSTEQKQKLMILKGGPVYSSMVDLVDEEVEKKISAFVDSAVKEAILKGELPALDPEKLSKMFKNGKSLPNVQSTLPSHQENGKEIERV